MRASPSAGHYIHHGGEHITASVACQAVLRPCLQSHHCRFQPQICTKIGTPDGFESRWMHDSFFDSTDQSG
jgi:hypothetical protein